MNKYIFLLLGVCWLLAPPTVIGGDSEALPFNPLQSFWLCAGQPNCPESGTWNGKFRVGLNEQVFSVIRARWDQTTGDWMITLDLAGQKELAALKRFFSAMHQGTDKTVTLTLREEGKSGILLKRQALLDMGGQAVAVFVLVAALLVVVLIGLKGVLREPSAHQIDPTVTPPFSLARVQMLIWTLVVLGCSFFIWLSTRQLPALPQSVWWLMGLSMATGLGSVLVRDAETQLTKGRAEPKHRTSSRGFFADVMSDGHGPSMHRMQMFIWTVALAGIFVAETYTKMKLHDFEGGYLALMGISSGTYLGFKFKEANPPSKK